MAELFERSTPPEFDVAGSPSEALDQATVLIAGQQGVSSSKARQWIRSHGFATGRPVDEIVRDVLALRLHFDDPTPT